MALSKENKDRIKKNGNKKLSNYEIDEAYDDAKVMREFTKFKPVKLSEKQKTLYEGIQRCVITSVTGPPGTAKAQPLDAKILTPTGWTTMGDIKIGQDVISVDGKSTKVTGVFPFVNKDVYTVRFSDGSYTRCCLDHIWHTWTSAERNYYEKSGGTKIKTHHPGDIRTTQEIMDSLYYGDKLNHSIPIVSPIEFTVRSLPLDPYLLGVLIGDDGMPHKIMFSSMDSFIVENIKPMIELLSCKLNIIKTHTNGHVEFSIVDKDSIGKDNLNSNNIKNILRSLGIFGNKSINKFIPEEYKISSIEDRIKILRGLLDTDGTISKDGTDVAFCTASHKLRDDVIDIVRSLGGIATFIINHSYFVYGGVRKQGHDTFLVSIVMPTDINPFLLPRKADRVISKTKYKPTRYITDISYFSNEPVQCISVDNDSHLYVTDNFIVTHNTFSACYAAVDALKKGEIKKIYLVKPLETSGEDMGFLPGDIEEKVAPFVASFIDNLNEMMDPKDVTNMMTSGVIEFVPIAFMRGRTLKDCYILADELQNCDIKQLMTLVTRMGKNTKMVLIGDKSQNDIHKKYVAFDIFVDKILGVDDLIFKFKFERCDIVRHPLLIKIVDNYENAEANGLLTETKKRN